MKAQALRGVCIGPGKHLLAGDVADLDEATFRFLASIGAVQAAPEPDVPAAKEPMKAPATAGKKES